MVCVLFMGALAEAESQFKDHHYRIACLLGQGKKQAEVALETGYSSARISRLRQIPAFRFLIERYRNKAEYIEFQAFRQVKAMMAAIHLEALDLLQDRIMDDPDSITNRELLDVIADMADRLGLSKVSRTESTSLNVDLADTLAVARRREISLSAVPTPPHIGGTEEEGPASASSGPAPQ